MKKLVLAGAIAAVASTSFAGSISDPQVEAPVVVAEAESSSAGITVPLLILAALLIAVAD